MRPSLGQRKERPLQIIISLRYERTLPVLLRVRRLVFTKKSSSNMWCFLGKTARRKSLKPDRSRKAVSKQKPIKNACFDAALSVPGPAKAPADFERSESRSQPEFAVVIHSPAMGEKEVKEGDLRAREGPYAERFEEALENTASPVAKRGNTETEVQQESAATEDLTDELPSRAPEFEENLAIEATSVETSELVEPEEVETSHEPPIDDKAIRIRLPSETGTPLTAPPDPIFVFGSTVNHELVVSPQSPSIQQESPIAESMSVPQSKLRTPISNSLQDNLHNTAKSTESLLIPRDSSAEPFSPVQYAMNKLDIAFAELVNADVLQSKDVGDLLSHGEATADDSGTRDDVRIPHEKAQSFDIEHEEVAAQSIDSPNLIFPAFTGMKTTYGNTEAGNCAEGEELDQGALTVLPKALSPMEAVKPYGSVVWDESNKFQSQPPKWRDEAERAGSYEQCGRDYQIVQGIIRSIEEDGEGTLASRIRDNQDDELSEYAASAPKPMLNTEAIAAMPVKTTRSGARFSDDTNLLKDFLNRAQAKKMVRDIKKPASAPPPTSPRRSPRKALTELTSNSPSPQKPKDLANRPGTPPGKQRLDAFSFDDVDELTAEPTSCRRSTRTRLPAPAKAPPGAPSFIPVRRADGTDAVVLQKSMAQELAVQTRANTRRNKGQSKPPNLALQNLTAETVETSSTRMHAHENSKSVGWDERLVYYSQPDHPNAAEEVGKEEKEEKEEKRPKGRKLRGLGATNRTLASKRVAEVTIPNGTPAPRRRGRLR